MAATRWTAWWAVTNSTPAHHWGRRKYLKSFAFHVDRSSLRIVAA